MILTTVLLAVLAGGDPRGEQPELVEVRKIWDAAPHNAFTDLVRHKDRWFCVFREGQGHVSPDGALRVITSEDGRDWTSAARLTAADGDLRDPKIAVTPDGRLMLTGASALHQPAPARHQTFAWFSTDGREWTAPTPIGEPDIWLWRVVWNGARCYGVGYTTDDRRFNRLYRGDDGTHFEPLVGRLLETGYPNESALVFLPDETCLALVRRDEGSATGQLGRSRPPYTDWTWSDLGCRIGGPQMVRLPDGRLVAAARRYDGKIRTSLGWVDPEAGTLTEFLALPSGGDTSYPGLAWHDGLLWVSYYASHEGRTSIYLAKVRLPRK